MTKSLLATAPDLGFRDDVIAGLSLPRKRLASKYFYDAAGSKFPIVEPGK